MQKKTILWTAMATTAAAGIAVYFIRRKKTAPETNAPGRKKDNHLPKSSSKTKRLTKALVNK